MKKQTIAVQCQSQTTCLCILHYHLQQKNIQVIKLNLKKRSEIYRKTFKLLKKVRPMQKKDSMKKL